MRALYQLSKKIAGFDFFPWLVMQKAHGATSVVFDVRWPKTDKFPLDEVRRRYESILLPGCALAELPCKEGYEGVDNGLYTQMQLNHLVSAGGMQVPRLKSVLPPGDVEYTVTLRKMDRWPHRNSREEDWRTFAAEIGATVIEDYCVQPLHLHKRMALYAGAKMNFFVTNGPVMLCFLSEYPAMGFDVQNSPPKGIEAGGRYPFLLEQHRQIWEPDTLENIRKHFDAWLKSRWV